MTLKAKKTLYVLVGIAISAILIYVLLQRIDFVQLGKKLKTANYWWLIPNVLFIILTMYQRAYRWRAMVQPIKIVPFHKLLAATCVGFMANNVLPLRLGEFVRAYSLSNQDKKVTKSASLATIFVERMVFDLVALLLIFGGVLYFSHIEMNPAMEQGLYVAIGIALLGILFMVTLALKPSQAGALLARYLFFVPRRWREKLAGLVLKFSRGLEFLTSVKSVLWVGFQTMMIWLLMGLSNIFVFKAMGMDLPLNAAYYVLVLVSLSILIPSTPGFVGVFHAGVVLALQPYEIGKEAATACAIVLHAAQYIVVTLLGFYFLKKEHLSLKKLEEEATESELTGVPPQAAS